MLSCVQRSMPSPVGPLRVLASETALTGVYLPEHRGAPPPSPAARDDHPVLRIVERELGEYFAGRRTIFTVPTAASGTDFQQQVWATLRTIPFGTRWSYRDLALAIDRPRAVRAVASANARNPLSILVPCHRVVGADGHLRGYAGGLPAKRWLLAHESSG